MNWVKLNSGFEWNDVQMFLDFVVKYTGKEICDAALFDEISNVREYVTNTKLKEWNTNHTPMHLRWVEIFIKFEERNIDFMNVGSIVEFTLRIPATNAPTRESILTYE